MKVVYTGDFTKLRSVVNKTTAKIVVDLSHCGLCNKLKSLISCMRLCDIQTKELYVYWKGYNCSISDIFKNNFKIVNTKPSPKLPSTYPPDCRLYLLPKEKEKIGSIECRYNNIPKEIRRKFLHYFYTLEPVNTIKKKIGSFEKQIPTNIYTIGVHIRRGDYMEKSDRNMGTDEKFMKAMDDHLNKKACLFYLSTDCASTEKTFKKRYGANIMMQKRKSRRRDKLGAIEAMTDLFLLSNRDHIIGSHLSTFTEVAWWFGGCGSIEIINK